VLISAAIDQVCHLAIPATVLTGTVELVIVGIAALATSVLSAVAGLGGGVVLLVVLAQFHPTAVAIPIQGSMQLLANGSRAAFLRGDIAWSVVWRSAFLLFPASFVGVAVATWIPEDAGRVVLAAFSLVFAWKPKILKWRGDRLPENTMIGVGALSGFLNSTIGVSGPVTSPMFRAVTASHIAFVASSAASQTFAHLAKISAFSVDGWRPQEFLDLIAVGIVGVLIGSRIGTRLVGRLPESTLGTVFRVTLTALAVRLLLTAVT